MHHLYYLILTIHMAGIIIKYSVNAPSLRVPPSQLTICRAEFGFGTGGEVRPDVTLWPPKLLGVPKSPGGIITVMIDT